MADKPQESGAPASAPGEGALSRLRRTGQGVASAPNRKRKACRTSSPLWATVKQLPPNNTSTKTHKCVICNELLTLTLNKNNSWVLTNVKRHLEHRHKDELKKIREPAAKKKQQIITLFHMGLQKIEETTMQYKINAARAAIHTFYTHNPQLISKSTITGVNFRELLRICSSVPPVQHNKLHLSDRTIVKLQEDEYDRWTKRLKQFIKLNLVFSRGNPFAQGLHDCVTLKNGKKFLAIGLACVDHMFKGNHMICLGFVPVQSSSAENVAAAINSHCQKIIGCEYTKIAHSTMSDYAALNVAEHFGHEREGCAMHNDDKCARYAVGDLKRTRKNREIEPFEDGVSLMNKAQKCATYFAWDHRRAHLRALHQFISGGVPNIVPKTNICTTRIAARHTTINSVLLLNRVLKHYVSLNPTDPDVQKWAMTSEEWSALAEMEAVTKVVTDTTTLAQTENAQMGAMGYVIHCELLKRLRSDQFEVLNLAHIKKDRQERHTVLVSDFTPVGRMCLKRARLEAERRLCGSKAVSVDNVSGSIPVKPHKREILCLALDPRTHYLVFVKTSTRSARVAACAAVKELYVNFFIAAERSMVDLQSFRAANPINVDNDDLFAIDHSDSNDSDGLTVEDWEAKRRPTLEKDFAKEFRAYSNHVKAVNWSEYGKSIHVNNIPTDAADVNPFAHLLNLNILPWIKAMPPHLSRIQLLLTHSKASVASAPAASFCERVASAGGIVSTKGNVRVDPQEISHRVPLRMNGSFWAFLERELLVESEDGDVAKAIPVVE